MIRVDALELVTVRQRHLFREEELNSLASEGDRLLALLPTLPKNVPYRLIAALLQENGFFFMPVMDDEEGKWRGYRNVVEVFSSTIPDTLPGIYIVALVTTQSMEIPHSLWNGDTLYLRS